ncbi:MAG: transcriptional regulator [Silvibacterium sp.]|nr:transcriptional regulator [Silvibacterium sp.]
MGPEGGDARAFAYDPGNPAHIYMGTTTSWIYQSTDGGATWKRLARLGKVDDLVVDNIVIDSSDPRTIYAGVWQLDRTDGGIYISHDGGGTWAASPDMDGQSVRALTQAPSDSKILVAGAISGVYRSSDSGAHWTRISPLENGELVKVESIAIDPTDPKIIYAGTWHLPWKTTDGGATWRNIKQGLIDDSDVFSIILDPARPSVVYLSACSGIYLSSTAGDLFHKVQGIPSTARRTRVLMQDPTNRSVVYAGTTEGLYKTSDSGSTWTRMTGPDVIINDVYVDPKNDRHVMLATDRSGVLTSQDATVTFRPTNSGFYQRQVSALLPDAQNPQIMYVGVVNDKTYGGVFVTEDGGKTWMQRGTGLGGRDVFSLAQSEDGTILAGTNHGIFRWAGSEWKPDGTVVNVKTKEVTVVRKGKKTTKTVTETSKPETIEFQVNDLSASGPVWFAATAEGVYRSTTNGATWTGPVINEPHYHFIDAHGSAVFAASRNQLRLSEDGGETWTPVSLPEKLITVHALATSPNGTLWLGGREGAFTSDDRGHTWSKIPLPVAHIDNIDYDATLKRIIVASADSTLVFAIDPTEKNWKWWDAGWNVRMVHSVSGRLVAASLYDGVVVEPKESEAGLSEAER